MNRLIAVVDELGGKTTYTYDALDNIAKVTDALRQVTSYTYDKNGNPTSETDALGNRVAVQLHAGGLAFLHHQSGRNRAYL